MKRKYIMIIGIRDASVKLLIKMALKAEEEEAGVLNMVELLSSPHDQLLALSHQQSQEEDDVGAVANLSMLRPLALSAGGLPG